MDDAREHKGGVRTEVLDEGRVHVKLGRVDFVKAAEHVNHLRRDFGLCRGVGCTAHAADGVAREAGHEAKIRAAALASPIQSWA